MKHCTTRDFLIAFALLVITSTSRLYFTTDAGNYFGIDPPLFAMGANDYSIIDNRPHLPGYILHVKSIKTISAITGDHSVSMVWLSIFYSSLAVVFIFMIFRKWFNPPQSLSYSLLLITNPMVWYFGCVPEIYAFDLFFGSAIVLCGLSGRMIFLTPLILALGTGVRQSSGALILPIYVFLWINYYRRYKPDIKHIIIVHIIGVILFLGWFIPMTNSVGGLKEYIGLYKNHGKISAFMGLQSFIINQMNFISICYTVFIPFIYPMVKWKFNKQGINKRAESRGVGIVNADSILKICFWWVVPILIFFIFYHYNKGYLLLITPGIVLFLAYLTRRINISVIYIYSIIAVQITMFVFFPHDKVSDEVSFLSEKRTISKLDVWLERLQGPYSMSYGSIRETNEGLKRVRNGITYCNTLFADNKYTGYFVSPTAQVIHNTLYMLYPQINIYYHYRGKGNKYVQCFSMEITKKQGLADMIEHAVIITSDSFYEKYLSPLCRIIYKDNDIIFSVVNNGQQDDFSKLYLELF